MAEAVTTAAKAQVSTAAAGSGTTCTAPPKVNAAVGSSTATTASPKQTHRVAVISVDGRWTDGPQPMPRWHSPCAAPPPDARPPTPMHGPRCAWTVGAVVHGMMGSWCCPLWGDQTETWGVEWARLQNVWAWGMSCAGAETIWRVHRK